MSKKYRPGKQSNDHYGPYTYYNNVKKTINQKEKILFDADINCEHIIELLWSGVKCKKCNGWFCY